MFWPSPQDARREYERCSSTSTVVVGNRAEVEVAVGTPRPGGGRPPAARPRGRAGAGQEGRRGRAGRDPRRDAHRRRRSWSTSSAASAPVTPSAGRWCTACSSGWDPVRIAEHANAAGAIVVARLACADAMPTARASSRRWSPDGGRRRDPHAGATGGTDPDDHAPGRSPMMAQQISDEQWRELLETRATRPGRGGRGLRQPQAAGGAALRAGHDLPGGGRPPRARGRSASGGDAMAMADRRGLLERLVTALSRPGRRRRARLARHRRGAAPARRARGQGRHRLDEPRRPRRRRLDDGRPLHRLRRGEHQGVPARGRQDAAAHRRRGRRHRADASRPAPRP